MNKRILWVEDDYFAIKGLMRPLEKDGFTFDIATSVLDFYPLSQQWSNYSLIIVDLILPLSESKEEEIPLKLKNLVENAEFSGIGLVKWLVMEMKAECPILILSTVEVPLIKFHLQECKSIKSLSKSGLLPSIVKQKVLDMIS